MSDYYKSQIIASRDQMLIFNYREINDQKFEFPFRMFISGSSQSGKTTFAGNILAQDLFREKISSVVYYHPDYLDSAPVSWHKELNVPVRYNSGQPTLVELTSLEQNACVVLDDIYEECINSKPIDYLFRVLSGKKNISVMIMSQRYFANGRYSMNVRNNVNYTVLLRNTDARINRQIAKLLNVERQFKKVGNFIGKYPYVFIDTSPGAVASGYRVYEDIFAKHKVVYSDDGMRGYVISEKEFERFFKVINSTTAAVKDENKEQKSREPSSDRSPEREQPAKLESTESSRAIERKRTILERLKRRRIERKTRQALSRS